MAHQLARARHRLYRLRVVVARHAYPCRVVAGFDNDATHVLQELSFVGGAGLDAFATEPLPADHALWKLENVMISPHSSNSSPNVRHRTMAFFVENLRRFKSGEELLNRVDLEAGY